MAEKINIIVTEEAIKELDRTVKLVQSLAAEITKVNTVSGSNNYSNLMKEQALETKKAADAIKLATLEKKAELEIEHKLSIAAKSKIALMQSEEKAAEKKLQAEKKSTENEIDLIRKKIALASSLNKQRYNEEAKLVADHDKALLFSHQQELKRIKDKMLMNQSLTKQKIAEIQAEEKALAKQLQLEERANAKRQAQEAKWSRTGANSAIPGMGAKIADIKEAEKLALANEKLNSAYNKLNKARTDAKNHLRDLIASEKASTSEINKAQKAFDLLDQKVRKADKAVGDMSKNVGNYKSAFSGLSNLMGAFGIGTGIYLAVDVAKNIYETTKALQSLDLALKMVSGSSEEFASNQAFITATAEKWGVEIKTLTEQYTYFYTAAKGLMSTAEIKTTFEGIAKAGAVMGLSLEKQSAAFYAFEQMMSKGIVTSEELKKQLGNSMPGAIRAAAMAYQELHPKIKTIQEAEMMLLKEMKRGAIDSATYVPLIVKNLEKLYGIEMVDKVETLQAAQNRLKNSWTDLVRSMNENETGGITSFFTFLLKNATTLLDTLTRINSSWDNLYKNARGKGLAEGEQMALQRFEQGGGTVSGANASLTVARKELIKIKSELLQVQKEGERAVKYVEENKYRVGVGAYNGADVQRLRERKELLIEQKAIQEQIIITTKKLRDEIGKPPKNTGGGTGTTETEEQRKAREKAEKERLEAIEKSAKIDYDLALSNAERKKEIIQDELDAFKGSVEQKIQLSMKLALAENEINKLKFKEDKRQAKGDGRLVSIAENVEFKAQGDTLQSHLKRVGGYYSEYFKSLENMPDTIFGDKFKLTPEQEKELDDYNKKIKETLRNQIKLFNDFVGDFANRSGFAQTFDSFIKEDKNGVSIMDTLFDDDAIMDKETKMKNTFLAITSAAQDMFNLIAEASQRNFEAEYRRLEEQKETAIKYAGDSATAKEKIEEDFDKKKRQIATREAKAKKQQAMMNIAIDTAQAIIGLWAKPGFPAAIPMTIAVGALGAAQLAMVAAQKIPQYWRGTKNAPEGLALTNEKGAEIHTDRHGNIKDFGHNNGATLTKMDAGDIVYTAEQSRKMMFENEYKGLLRNNGISGAKPKNGLTAAEMEAVMVKTLGGRPTLNMNFDKGGFGTYISKNGNITRQSESRGSGRGIEV